MTVVTTGGGAVIGDIRGGIYLGRVYMASEKVVRLSRASSSSGIAGNGLSIISTEHQDIKVLVGGRIGGDAGLIALTYVKSKASSYPAVTVLIGSLEAGITLWDVAFLYGSNR